MGQSLERRGGPAATIADDFESASHKQLVYVDRRGAVGSAKQYQRRQLVARGALAAVVAGAPVAYGLMFGAWGVAAAVALVGFISVPLIHDRRIRRGVDCLVDERLDEAERLFRSVAGSRFSNRVLRGLAWQNLAGVSARRGDFETAFANIEKARELLGGTRRVPFGRSRRRSILANMCDLAGVQYLLELGRDAEAEARFLEASEWLPDGEYIRVQKWAAELYLSYASDRVDLGEDELHDRARIALGITTAVSLLILLAWSFWKLGDQEHTGLLLGQALDREGIERVEACMPRLWAWVAKHEHLAQSL